MATEDKHLIEEERSVEQEELAEGFLDTRLRIWEQVVSKADQEAYLQKAWWVALGDEKGTQDWPEVIKQVSGWCERWAGERLEVGRWGALVILAGAWRRPPAEDWEPVVRAWRRVWMEKDRTPSGQWRQAWSWVHERWWQGSKEAWIAGPSRAVRAKLAMLAHNQPDAGARLRNEAAQRVGWQLELRRSQLSGEKTDERAKIEQLIKRWKAHEMAAQRDVPVETEVPKPASAAKPLPKPVAGAPEKKEPPKPIRPVGPIKKAEPGPKAEKPNPVSPAALVAGLGKNRTMPTPGKSAVAPVVSPPAGEKKVSEKMSRQLGEKTNKPETPRVEVKAGAPWVPIVKRKRARRPGSWIDLQRENELRRQQERAEMVKRLGKIREALAGDAKAMPPPDEKGPESLAQAG